MIFIGFEYLIYTVLELKNNIIFEQKNNNFCSFFYRNVNYIQNPYKKYSFFNMKTLYYLTFLTNCYIIVW